MAGELWRCQPLRLHHQPADPYGWLRPHRGKLRQEPWRTGDFTDFTGRRAMAYYQDVDYTGQNPELNYYYYMAAQFALSDRWFSPVSSKTIPNRLATMSGGTTRAMSSILEATTMLRNCRRKQFSRRSQKRSLVEDLLFADQLRRLAIHDLHLLQLFQRVHLQGPERPLGNRSGPHRSRSRNTLRMSLTELFPVTPSSRRSWRR